MARTRKPMSKISREIRERTSRLSLRSTKLKQKATKGTIKGTNIPKGTILNILEDPSLSKTVIRRRGTRAKV